jgi:hypothetical protein
MEAVTWSWITLFSILSSAEPARNAHYQQQLPTLPLDLRQFQHQQEQLAGTEPETGKI